MKSCEYCGRENADDASRCQECGTAFSAAPPKAQPSTAWDRIATLESEVEAERLDVDLNDRDIPHALVSYNDTAFNGIFQTTRGWGHVEGPTEHRDAILSVLNDLRQSNSESAEAEPGEPS